MKTLRIGTTARILGVLIVCGLAVFPLYWIFVTALTSDANLFSAQPQLFPDFSRLYIFGEVFAEGQILVWLGNSLLIAAGTSAVAILLGIPFGYALSRFEFKGKVAVTVALFMTQMLPEALLVVPLFATFRHLGLLNSQFGLILANASVALPVVAFILKGAIDGIPKSIEEAARVDGCRPFTILARINVPLIAPSVAACAVISFFHGWNEYVFAVTFLVDPAVKPASVGLSSFIGELSTPMQTVMGVAFIYTLPAVVFYLLAQKYVVHGMTTGAVKE